MPLFGVSLSVATRQTSSSFDRPPAVPQILMTFSANSISRTEQAFFNSKSQPKGALMNKTFNLIIMVLMFALAINELYRIVQFGANPTNILFLLLFSAFAVRRLLIHNKLSS